MGAETKIEWCHHSWNPVIGCTKVDAGCTHCYAETETFPRVQRSRGRELWGPRGERHRTSPAYWKQPIKWDRDAAAAGERRRVFCASMSDVFEDHPVWNGGVRAEVLGLIDETPHLDWLLLTKRPAHAAEILSAEISDETVPHPRRNLWLGTSVSDQESADKRVPELLRAPAVIRFLSVEPLLGQVDLRNIAMPNGDLWDVLRGELIAHESGCVADDETPRIDWVIVGGESGPHARPCDVAWIRDIVLQCKNANVPCFVKQMGSVSRVHDVFDLSDSAFETFDAHGNMPHFPATVRLLDKGGDLPEDLRVREFPVTA